MTAQLTQEAAAEAMGVTKQSWQQYESASVQAILRLDMQERLASAVNSTVEALHEIANQEIGATKSTVASPKIGAAESEMLTIRDRVQAGAWLLSDDSRQIAKVYPTVRDPRYPYADQWLSEVVGDSVNKLNIFEGDLVHCVDAVAIGYWPQTGHIVEAERSRFGGQERELSLKQVEVTSDGILLWPRSTNLRWKEPLTMAEGLGENEEAEVRIRSLVLAAIRRFQ